MFHVQRLQNHTPRNVYKKIENKKYDIKQDYYSNNIKQSYRMPMQQ